MAGTVDVAINVYGKPFQTAVALLSLLKFSGGRFDKIYFIKESWQPREEDFRFIFDLLGDRLVLHVPRYWLWYGEFDTRKLGDADYRRSIRYQFAWEESGADHLYITHNDVLYTGDIVGALLSELDGYLGVGQVGQCWNCPAKSARLCGGDSYLEYRPSYEEVLTLARQHPPPRGGDYRALVERESPWPLPECRLNEWVALVNLKLARPETAPYADAPPFGAMGLDTGTAWFRTMSLKGYRFKNYDFGLLARHGWASETGNGHSALFNDDLYESSEAVAREKLLHEFGVPAASLPRTAERRPRAR